MNPKGRSPLGGIFRTERNIPLQRNRAERKSNLHYKKRSRESAGNRIYFRHILMFLFCCHVLFCCNISIFEIGHCDWLKSYFLLYIPSKRSAAEQKIIVLRMRNGGIFRSARNIPPSGERP